MSILFTYLHFVSIFLLVSCLVGEYVLLLVQPRSSSLPILKKLDIAYGISAVLVLATGISRIFLEKGADYYLENHAFWTKMVLFLIIGGISAYPTILFLKARSETDISDGQYHNIKKALRTQIVLVLPLVLCAVMMARFY